MNIVEAFERAYYIENIQKAKKVLTSSNSYQNKTCVLQHLLTGRVISSHIPIIRKISMLWSDDYDDSTCQSCPLYVGSEKAVMPFCEEIIKGVK